MTPLTSKPDANVGVYRNVTDLVQIAGSMEEALEASSKFHDNRKYYNDTYEVRHFDIFTLREDDFIPDFIHQIIPYLGQHLHYKFLYRDKEHWQSRDFMSGATIRVYNEAYKGREIWIRAKTDEEAMERFSAVLMQQGAGNEGSSSKSE